MNKTFFVVLVVCLVSAQAFVKRDAPADSQNYMENLQKQMQEMSANIGEKMKTAFDPNTIKKNFNEFIDNTNKAFQSMQPKQ